MKGDTSFEVIEQCKFTELKWLDLGCGTESLEKLAYERFHHLQFIFRNVLML